MIRTEADIERENLEAELNRTLASTCMPTAEAIARKTRRIEDLEEQLAKFPARSPPTPTGMLAGTVITADGRLGEGFERPDDSTEFHEHHSEYDPWQT